MKIFRAIIFLYILFSCDSQKEPEWSIDMDKWKSDKNACSDIRETSFDELSNNKDLFLKWPERQINRYLGRPDRHRLSKRHQKFYVYFLESGKQCDSANSEFGRYLQLRFDATGYINEVEIRNEFEILTD